MSPGAGSNIVIYKDDRGQLFVLDEMEKVPARYRDRAVEVHGDEKKPGAKSQSVTAR